MRKNKISIILQKSIRNKMLVASLAISLIGISGMTTLSSTSSLNNLSVNKTVLAQESNLLSAKTIAHITNVSTVVNLREHPTTSSSVLARFKNNTAVTVLEKEGGWYKVDVNGTVGYIYQDYISTSDTMNENNSSSKTVAHITNVSTAVNLREYPTTSSKVLTSLRNNTSVIILKKEGSWYKVSANGKVGYVYQNYISTSNNSKIIIHNVNEAIALVSKKIGTSDNRGKIEWGCIENEKSSLFTGNNGVKFYFIRGQHESFIKHREETNGCGSYDGLDYYVLQDGTVINRSSEAGENIF